MTTPNGQVTITHIGCHFHPHRHITIAACPGPCSGRWWCEKHHTWITGPKCHKTPERKQP